MGNQNQMLPAAPSPETADALALGQVLANSGYFKDATDASKAVVKILYGKELGIGAVVSMQGIDIVKGKPSLGASLIAALIKRSGKYTYRVEQHNSEICFITFWECWNGDWKKVGQSSYKMEDAKRAGLAGNPNWQKRTARRLGLESSLRPKGRPRLEQKK